MKTKAQDVKAVREGFQEKVISALEDEQAKGACEAEESQLTPCGCHLK